MPETIVVVTFYSRGGATEKLATAAAVGAVQSRAGIRMRRVADVDPARTLGQFPESAEHLRRMHNEYVPPREADILAADALIVGSPAYLTASSAEWAPLFEVLRRLHAEGRLAGKVGAAIGNGPALATLTAALREMGLAPVPLGALNAEGTHPGDINRAMALGRQVVSVAQGLVAR